MSNSKYVSYTKLSPNYSKRNSPITKITIHHAAVINASLAGLGNGFAQSSRQASSNTANDDCAITIEVANSSGAPDWKVSDKAYEALINLCVDICKRNNIKELNYTGTKDGNLTRHNMFTATTCPGSYLQSRFPDIANRVNKELKQSDQKTLYRVQVGAFSQRANAERLAKELKAKGYDAIIKEG